MKTLSTIFGVGLLLSSSFSISQTIEENAISTEDYLSELFASGQRFEDITFQADNYFSTKYPDLAPYELTIGEHRDGNFVKYQRWKSFWKNHLNPDGTLGDFTKASHSDSRSSRDVECTGDEYLVEWTNSNYSSNMGWQIDQGRTSAMAFHPTDPNTYWVGAAFGGLWKTTNGGSSYTLLNDDLPLAAISGIAIDPDNPDNIAISLSDIVWYGPSGIGIYVSNDGGVTFEQSGPSWELNENVRIYYMDQDPNNGNRIMIATNDGLFKTEDFFETFDLVSTTNMRHVTFSQSVPDLVFAGSSNGRFYRSTDGGDSFGLVTDFGDGHVRIAVPLASAGSDRVVATNGSNLQLSTDNGMSFTTVSLPESNMVIEFEPGSEDILNVGNFEVYRSNNFGTSFNVLTHWYGDGGLPWIHVDQRNIFVNPLQDDYVYFCNDGGIFRYDNDASVFANLSSDLIITQYYDIAVSQTEEMVLGAGSQDNGNVYREDDGSWDRYAQTGDGMGQEIDPENAGTRYWSYQYGAIRRWEAGFNTNIAPPGEDGAGAWETPFKIDPNNSNALFIGYQNVYYSSNQGDSWTTVGGTVSSSGDLQQLAIAPSNSDQLYATEWNNFYAKAAGSDSWDEYSTPINQYISDLEVDFEDEEVVYISYSGYNDGDKVYRSDNGGISWVNISDNLPNLPIRSLELYDNGQGGIFVGTYGAIYYRDNTMDEWVKFGCLPNTEVSDIEIQYFTNRIFAGTHGRGIFEADLEFAIANNEDFSAGATQLVMYPNPATNNVSIKAKVGALEGSTLKVTDLLGKELQLPYQMVDGEIKVDCSSLSAGNYVLQVINAEGTQSDFKLTIR